MRNIKLINGIEILYEKLRNWKISKLKNFQVTKYFRQGQTYFGLFSAEAYTWKGLFSGFDSISANKRDNFFFAILRFVSKKC